MFCKKKKKVLVIKMEIYDKSNYSPSKMSTGFPGGSDGKKKKKKKSTCDTRDMGLIPRLGKSPREGNGNPLQYSCVENPMDRGAWQVAVP